MTSYFLGYLMGLGILLIPAACLAFLYIAAKLVSSAFFSARLVYDKKIAAIYYAARHEENRLKPRQSSKPIQGDF